MKITIFMTDEQRDELRPLFDQLEKMNDARGVDGEYGLIIGQLDLLRSNKMRCGFGVFDYETAKKICDAVSGEKP